MYKQLLAIAMAVTSSCFAQPNLNANSQNINTGFFDELISTLGMDEQQSFNREMSLVGINRLLSLKAYHLDPKVINKVITSLACAGEYNIPHKNILTIIDYSKPSNEKRLWIFDLEQKKLLFNTYVSHGIKSGAQESTYFSNKYNSKASSIGVYATTNAYYGREGLSLRLNGLDRGFNDNAENRSLVMHGGWYVEEPFIKKYGRAGRSWGCPALPEEQSSQIINTIKDNSMMVIYYPSDEWFSKSKFLNCARVNQDTNMNTPIADAFAIAPPPDFRENIVYADLNGDRKHQENDPVLAIAADRYQQVFKTVAPLDRMLRRQINHAEYVVLSTRELTKLIDENSPALSAIVYVVPEIKMVRGYYNTQMRVVDIGLGLEYSANGDVSYTVHRIGKSEVPLLPSNDFIRWVGL